MIEQKSALVTGASSGIGLAYAEMLADEGHDLTIVARNADRLAQAAERLRQRDVRVQVKPADLIDEEQLVAAFSAHAQAYGSLDVLVNSAGIAGAKEITDMTTDFVDEHFALNVRAVVLAYREAVPLLRKAVAARGTSHVFNIASVGAHEGHAWLSMYTASKAAIVNFTQAMQQELLLLGIKSTAICPGYVDTPMSDPIKGHIPADSMIRPQDVVALTRPLLHLSAPCVVPELIIDRIRVEELTG